ncbi:hypothetical protein [Ensifer aridi]|nr:hypothetical protein [Ensifer aridi]
MPSAKADEKHLGYLRKDDLAITVCAQLRDLMKATTLLSLANKFQA